MATLRPGSQQGFSARAGAGEGSPRPRAKGRCPGRPTEQVRTCPGASLAVGLGKRRAQSLNPKPPLPFPPQAASQGQEEGGS